MTFSLKNRVMDEMTIRRIRSFGSKPTLWASQASAVNEVGEVYGKCLRASFYGKKGIPETNPVSDAVTIMGYMGLRIEDGIIEILKNQGIWENNNVKWQAKGLSGEVDAVIRVMELNEETQKMEEVLYVVEVKSCSGYYINKEVYGYNSGRGANKVYIPGKPKDQHLMQSAIYADIAKSKCKGTILIYVSRDEAKLTDFLVTIGDDDGIYIDGVKDLRFDMHDIYSRYNNLRDLIEENTLPLGDYKHTFTDAEVEDLFARKGISAAAKKAHMDKKKPHMDKGCLYCSHRDLCLRDGLLSIQNYKIEPKKEPIKKIKADFDWFENETPAVAEVQPDCMVRGSF